jgi:protoporphyrinogen oxidase
MVNRKEVVVAGGGPSGLFTAWKLAEAGHGVVLLERESRVGGLAATQRRKGNHYALGTHHLHSPKVEDLAPFKALLSHNLLELDRRLTIKFMDRFYPYPLSVRDLLGGLPFPLLVSSLSSLAWILLYRRLKARRPENAEEAIIALYGRKLYEVMFRDYTARFWGMPPSRISPTFVEQRMPGINAVEGFKKLLARLGVVGRTSLGKTAVIGSGKMYTTPQGTGVVYEAISEAIQRLGGRVLTGAELIGVKISDGVVKRVVYRQGEEEREADCDLFVSTIPLPHLIERLDPAPAASVLDAAGRIGFRGLLVVGLLVKPKKKLDAMFTYFPDRSFHRLAEIGCPPARIQPPESTILLAEITCDAGDEVWNDPAPLREKVIQDLVEEGLVEKDGVQEVHFLKAAEAYPKYTLGFEDDLDTLKNHLEKHKNLVSTGRQGAFRFTSMIPSMQMAWNDTQRLLEGTNAERSAP